MGNSTPKLALNDIDLAPSNLLVEVFAHKYEARDGGDARYPELLRGRVLRISNWPDYCSHGTMMDHGIKEGDLVYVRGRKGYPVKLEDQGRRTVFVFNVWDIAMKGYFSLDDEDESTSAWNSNNQYYS